MNRKVPKPKCYLRTQLHIMRKALEDDRLLFKGQTMIAHGENRCINIHNKSKGEKIECIISCVVSFLSPHLH